MTVTKRTLFQIPRMWGIPLTLAEPDAEDDNPQQLMVPDTLHDRRLLSKRAR